VAVLNSNSVLKKPLIGFISNFIPIPAEMTKQITAAKQTARA
jgi:hypothetical protein